MVTAAFLLPQPAPPGMLAAALDRWSGVAALGSGAYVGFLGSAGQRTSRRPTRRTHNIVPGPEGGHRGIRRR